LTSKGQTTIPKSIRDRLNLKPGDRLEFVLQGDRQVLLIPANVGAAELRGILPRTRKRVTLADMDRAVREGAAARTKRGR
jgi:AbrB family looped-hinge helix DNA binding protein